MGTDDSSLGSFPAGGDGANGAVIGGNGNADDADIDEAFSEDDGGVVSSAMDDGGESTEPDQPDRTMYFGQADEVSA